MLVQPRFSCLEEPEWSIYVKDGEIEVQRCSAVGEAISLGHGRSYKVIEVTTDLYQDDIWLYFDPLTIEDFIFIYWDEYSFQANTNRRWIFSPGQDESGEERFLKALVVYEKKVDEEL